MYSLPWLQLCGWICEEVWGCVELTGKNLEGSSEEEASALLQSEELAEEEEERDAAEDDGEDHESLDRLNPLCRGRRSVLVTNDRHP